VTISLVVPTPAGTLLPLQLCQDAHGLTLQNRFRGVGHTPCSCVSTREYTTAKDIHVKKVYEDANLQNGDGRNQMWSGFPRRLYASAHVGGQVLTSEGQTCSLGRAFTTSELKLKMITTKHEKGCFKLFVDRAKRKPCGKKSVTLLLLKLLALPYTFVAGSDRTLQ
jgi:hypothetical protein